MSAALDAAAVVFPGSAAPVGPFTFEVPTGPGLTALTGPADAGKSTALALLLGLVAPTAGTVRPAAPDTARAVAYAFPIGRSFDTPAPEATTTIPSGVSLIVSDDVKVASGMSRGLFAASPAPYLLDLAARCRVVAAEHDRNVRDAADQTVTVASGAPGGPRCPAVTVAPVLLDGAPALAVHPHAVQFVRGTFSARPVRCLVPVETWGVLYRSRYI